MVPRWNLQFSGWSVSCYLNWKNDVLFHDCLCSTGRVPKAKWVATAHLTRLKTTLKNASKRSCGLNMTIVIRNAARKSISACMSCKSIELQHTSWLSPSEFAVQFVWQTYIVFSHIHFRAWLLIANLSKNFLQNRLAYNIAQYTLYYRFLLPLTIRFLLHKNIYNLLPINYLYLSL